MISYQKWRDRRDWFSVSWRVMKMNDTFRKRSVWIERGRPRWSHIYVWTFLFNSISLGIEIGNLESTNPLGSYLFWFYAPRHAMFEMKRHQKRLRKRKQPRRKRRRKIGLETRWTMICFYMIMNYDTYIYIYIISEMNTLISRLRLHILLQKEVGSIRHGWVSSFAHVFTSPRLLCEVRHQILSKTQGSKLHGWIGENEPICKLDVGFLVPVLP